MTEVTEATSYFPGPSFVKDRYEIFVLRTTEACARLNVGNTWIYGGLVYREDYRARRS